MDGSEIVGSVKPSVSILKCLMTHLQCLSGSSPMEYKTATACCAKVYHSGEDVGLEHNPAT